MTSVQVAQYLPSSMFTSPELPAALQEGVAIAEALIQEMVALAPQPRPHPDTLEPLYATAVAALNSRQHEQAQAVFGVLVAQAPDDWRFHAGFAEAHALCADLDLAHLHYALAIHLAPEQLALRLSMAQVLMAQGLTGQAQLLLWQVAALTSDMPEQAKLHERAEALLQLASGSSDPSTPP